MQQIIQQLEVFMLGAVPTALLFIVLVLAYQFLVQGPLSAVLKQRRGRTDGAVEQAHQTIAKAEVRAVEYVERLRLARTEVYKVREQRVKQCNAEREAALGAARQMAALKVSQAKAEIDAEAVTARNAVQASAQTLIDQVVRAVLRLAAGGAR